MTGSANALTAVKSLLADAERRQSPCLMPLRPTVQLRRSRPQDLIEWSAILPMKNRCSRCLRINVVHRSNPIRALVVAAIMLVAASLEASAQDRIIFGEAGTSCGTWTQARQTKSRKAGLAAQWVAGYLSGSNVEADHPADVLVGTNFDGLMAWIDNSAGRTLSTLSVLLP
jgi:hypothetical protein